MRRESVALLWHARDAALAAVRLTTGYSFDEYLNDEKLRLAVERAFSIVGEALGKLRKIDSETASQIPNVADMIGFRNVLIHAYFDIDDRVVWAAATRRAPELLAAIRGLLGDDAR